MINKNLKLFYFKYIKNTIETKTLKKIIRALGGKNFEITIKLEEDLDKFRYSKQDFSNMLSESKKGKGTLVASEELEKLLLDE
uniref:hypothetical protein n=1 Tax=Riemerella anatipestifer TaxID=34085 RepID=UPI00159EDB68|nr:hypothetical protein [Riemerella anatipestifer]